MRWADTVFCKWADPGWAARTATPQPRTITWGPQGRRRPCDAGPLSAPGRVKPTGLARTRVSLCRFQGRVTSPRPLPGRAPPGLSTDHLSCPQDANLQGRGGSFCHDATEKVIRRTQSGGCSQPLSLRGPVAGQTGSPGGRRGWGNSQAAGVCLGVGWGGLGPKCHPGGCQDGP